MDPETPEAAVEAELRQWAVERKISSKAVDILIKDGFNLMDAMTLLDKDDLAHSKMPRGQQKLVLKSLELLRPSNETNTGTSAVAVEVAADRAEVDDNSQQAARQQSSGALRYQPAATSIRRQPCRTNAC